MSDTGLTPEGAAEELLRSAAETGQLCDLTNQTDGVRGAFLRSVLLRNPGGGPGGPAAPLQVAGAVVRGELDLRGVKIPETILLRKCTFEHRIDAGDLRCETLLFDECNIRNGIVLQRATADGSIFLRRCTILGSLELVGAHVTGDLELRGSRLRLKHSARLERLRVDGSLFIDEQFSCATTLDLRSARIGGSIVANRAVFRAPVGAAVRLLQAKIDGGVEFRRSAFLTGGAVAIDANGMNVEQHFTLARARVCGAVELAGSGIGLNLTLVGARISAVSGKTPPGQFAVWADTTSIGGHVRLDNATVRGGLSLNSARIGGSLNLTGVTLSAEGSEFALSAESAAVEGNVVIVQGPGARPGTHRPARLTGRVSFTSAEIGRSVIVDKAVFACATPAESEAKDSRTGTRRDRVNLNRMRIGAVLQLHETCFHGRPITLANTRAGSLADDMASWNSAGSLLLNGFDYGILLGDAATSWRERRMWLLKQADDDLRRHPRPQPFSHLSSVLRRMGHERDARMISILRRRTQRRALRWYSPRRWGGWLLDATSGYGYRPWLALVWIGFLALLGAGVFRAGQDGFIPVRDRVYLTAEWSAKRQLPPGYPAFDPIVYSLDVLIPFANFGQKDFWTPSNTGSRFAVASYVYRPVHMMLGWLFSTIFVGAVTGLIKRE